MLTRIEQSSAHAGDDSDELFFFDQTSEVMGGIHLEVPAGVSGYKYAEVTLSEELDGTYGSGAILYPMRTGNRYRYLFLLDPAERSVFDIHEYALPPPHMLKLRRLVRLIVLYVTAGMPCIDTAPSAFAMQS